MQDNFSHFVSPQKLLFIAELKGPGSNCLLLAAVDASKISDPSPNGTTLSPKRVKGLKRLWPSSNYFVLEARADHSIDCRGFGRLASIQTNPSRFGIFTCGRLLAFISSSVAIKPLRV